MTEGLRIGRIAVEGFKGFAGAQEIDIRNRRGIAIFNHRGRTPRGKHRS